MHDKYTKFDAYHAPHYIELMKAPYLSGTKLRDAPESADSLVNIFSFGKSFC